MPATPAWPPQSAPRLYVETALAAGAQVTLEGNAAHYLASVMRLTAGDAVLLFDGRSGEWLARIDAVAKRSVTLAVERQSKPPETVPDLWLCVAPIKKAHFEFLLEKATELGAAEIRPILTRRSVVDKLNADRLHAHIVEAAEQCGRTALPVLHPVVKLPRLLKDWPAGRALYFADERGGADFAATVTPARGPAAILIGPEGGFDDAERAAICTLAEARAVSLGPRILRAETAAIAALSAWMALAGDWRA